jgi:hypothetical protein
VHVVPSFDDYSNEEQQSPTSQFADQRSSQPVYDSYESNSELDMQDFQEHTVQSLILYLLKEIIMRKSAILGLQKTLSNTRKRRFFPRVLFMMIMNLTLGEPRRRRGRTRGETEGAVYLLFRSCP